MGSLFFVGLGLGDEYGLSFSSYEKVKKAEIVYIDMYTNPMLNFSIERLEKLLGKPVRKIFRRDLEENAEETIIEDSKKHNVVLLIPGDPMIATTHIALRLQAHRKKIRTEVLHGVSIYSAAPAISGLQNYKFGKTVTIPFRSEIYNPETPYDIIKENTLRGAHTLVLLDCDVEKGRYMTIKEGLRYLLEIEEKRKEKIVTPERLAIGLAAVGTSNVRVKADKIKKLLLNDFEEIPQCLIFPGELHFIEAEALSIFANAPPEAIRK